MSKVVDERVVEMRFDNSRFESNVKTTMSTLDKLKQSLNLSGASKGLEDVASTAKSITFSGLAKAIDGINVKFSALEVVGMTALANITNSAVNAGKRIASALTLDSIRSGLSEYETQINSVQTILANTQSKGSTLTDVNRALDQLNEYADLTIYNFTEMTRNIGTFTAAGVELDMAVDAIKGIANLAAVSGSSSQQASTAMYQLSQAIAAGRVSLMDWNSVVNAGMGGELFQEALKRTSRVLGTGVDEAIEKYGTFRESLTQGGWLTTEVLTETLKQLSGAYTEADLIAQGFTQSQAREITELADTAVNAATKVKTFTQLWDTLKESAQSGWTQSWELILGDFEEARTFFTELQSHFSGILGKRAEKRNTLLGDALNSNWKKLQNSMFDAGISNEKFNEMVGKALEKHGYNVEEVTKKYGSLEKAFQSGAISSDILREAVDGATTSLVDLSGVETGLSYGEGLGGFSEDVASVQQALVNLGYDLGQFGEKADGVDGRFGEMTQNAIRSFQEINGLEVTGIIDQATLDKIEELSTNTIEAKEEWKGFIDEIDKLGGRQLLIDSLWNIIHTIESIAGAIGKAWNDIFPPMTADKLYGLIEGFNEFTKKLKPSQVQLNRISSIFRGFFAVIDIGKMALGAVWDAIKPLLSGIFDLGDGLLLQGGILGGWLVKLRDWIKETGFFGDAIAKIGEFVKNAGIYIKDFIDNILSRFELPTIDDMVTSVKKFFGVFKGGSDISFLDGIVNALSNIGFEIPDAGDALEKLKSIAVSTFDSIKSAISGFATKTKEHFSNIGERLREFIDNFMAMDSFSLDNIIASIGDFFTNVVKPFFNFDGIFEGFKNGITSIGDWISEKLEAIGGPFKTLGENIASFFENLSNFSVDLNFGKIFAVLFSGGLIFTLKKIGDALEIFSGPLEQIGEAFEELPDIAENVGKVIKNFGKLINAKAWELKSKAILNLAFSIGVIALSVALLTQLDQGKMWSSVGAIAAISAVLVGLTFAISKLSIADGLKVTSLFAVAGAIAIIAGAAKLLSTIDVPDLIKAGVAIGAFMFMFTKVMQSSDKIGPDSGKSAGMFMGMAAAILILAVAAKKLGSMDTGELVQAGIAISAFLFIFSRLMNSSDKIGPNANKSAGMFIGMAAAILLIAHAAKKLGSMDTGELLKAGIVIGIIFAVFDKFMKGTTNLGSGSVNAGKTGLMFMGMAAGVMLLAMAAKTIAGMDAGEMLKAGVAIGVILGMFTIVMKKTQDLGRRSGNAAKVGAMFVGMSAAILLLAGAMRIIGGMEVGDIAKATAAISIIILMFSKVIKSTKDMGKASATLISLAIAVAALGAVLVVLSITDTKGLGAATAALSIVLLAFSKVVKSVKTIEKGMGALIVLTIAIGVLGTVLYLLSTTDGTAALQSAFGMALVIGALSMLVDSIANIRTLSPKAFAALGMAMLALAEVAGILVLFDMLDVGTSVETAAAMSVMLLSLSAVTAACAKIGRIPGGAVAAAKGAAMLDLVVLIIGALGLVLGALAKIPGLGKLLDDGAELAEKIGNFIGKFVGGILGGIVEGTLDGFSNGVEKLGDALNSFAEAVGDISYGDASTGVGAAIQICKDIISLSAEIPPYNIFEQYLGWNTKLETFGDDVVALGEDLAAFSTAVAGVTYEGGTSDAIKVAQDLAEVAKVLPDDDTWWDKFTGQTKMAQFAQDFSENLAPALNVFSQKVSKLEYSTGTENAIKLASDLADIAATLPDDDTWWDKFTGQTKMAQFAQDFSENLAPALNLFATTVAKIEYGNGGGVDNAVKLSQDLCELANSVPQLEFWEKFWGISNFGQFANDIRALGRNLRAFSMSICAPSEYFTYDQGKIDAAVNLATSLKDIANAVPQLEFWDKLWGISNFGQFAEDIGALGTNLRAFSKSICAPSEDFTYDQGKIDTAVALAGSLKDLANGVPQLTFWEKFWGISNFGQFSQDIGVLGTNLRAFSKSICAPSDEFTYDQSKIDAAVNLAISLKDIANAVPQLTFWEKFWGISNFGQFSQDIGVLGVNLQAFGEAICGPESKFNYDEAKINGAMNIADKLVTFAPKIPAKGFWANLSAKLFGISDMTSFTTGIGQLGENLAAFGTAICGENSTFTYDETKVDNAISLATKLAEFAPNIPEVSVMDAFTKWAVDETKMTMFADGIAAVGEGLSTFATAVSGLNDDGVAEAATRAANIARALSTVQSNLDEEGGPFDWLNGTTGEAFENFPTNIGYLGDGIKKFADKISEIKDFNVENVTGAATSIQSLGYAVKAINDTLEMWGQRSTRDNVDFFGEQIVSLAGKLYDFKVKLEDCGIDETVLANISSAVTSVSDLTTSINNMATIDTTAVDNFASAISKLAGADYAGLTEAVAGFDDTVITNITNALASIETSGGSIAQAVADGISASTAIGTSVTTMVTSIMTYLGLQSAAFKLQGTNIVLNIATGISTAKTFVASSIFSVLSNAASAISLFHGSFVTNGMYLGDGLAMGISAKTTTVYNAAYALGQAAVQGEKDGQASNSPSKLTIQAGKWLGEGLIIGINKMGDAVYASGHSIGETAASSISNAMSLVNDIVNSDIDSQPTIRPVLDLTDVESKAGLISNLFGTTDVGSVSLMMNRQLQNGKNDDVVSALGTLTKKIDTLERPSYNINGITYDDGSAISNAVETLVRAVVMEGRS